MVVSQDEGFEMSVHSNRLLVAPARQNGKLALRGLMLLAISAIVAAGLWAWLGRGEAPKPKGPGIVPVTSALVTVADVPVRLSANGTVTPLQSVDVRAQISATIKAVHVKEGQYVRQGDRLFSLDVRTEDANLGKAEAQLIKSRADLANAERNLQRQRELFSQKFISQTALDTVQNQVDSLGAQVAADRASVASSRVARGFGEIIAPIAGRIGTVAVYPGSLVQPSGAALVSITQIDPINVSFTLPERELPALQKSLGSGALAVTAQLDGEAYEGRLIFVDNSVDSGSGTIRLKAVFANPGGKLWPGMFVTVALSPRTLTEALSVPAQAVQTGPEKKFLYVIGDEGKVGAVPVRVLLIQNGQAMIEGEGVKAGTQVVVEGAQNLRPGSKVTEARSESAQPARKPGKP
jgi:RND family efflux transporter MFP subunit